MKTRILFSTFLLIVVSGIILSCKKESTDPVPEAATVVNSWRIIEATNDSGKIVPVSNGGTIDIKSNGHFIIANSSLFRNGGGTWHYAGSIGITLIFDDVPVIYTFSSIEVTASTFWFNCDDANYHCVTY